jgi:NADPH-dependent ferric siderophore reductase
MIRITLSGSELAGFTSPSPDDHIRVFLPDQTGTLSGRDYTPRLFDSRQNLLSIDFVVHDGGLGSSWAQQAKPGVPLQIGGPRGSTIISEPKAWWLLIGDETALPSIGRRLEEMPVATRVITVAAVNGHEEEQQFETKADCSSIWVHRPAAQAVDPAPHLSALADLKLPPGPGFIWIAAEKEVSRALRDYCVGTLGHSPDWIKASSYWSQHLEDKAH